jgi:peptide-N4-(N-acetyl-beta-glucosaminyl)asparagine amidase
MFETLGYKARWVVDWADHVWVEILMRGRWVHVDPCEASIDEPFLYEGWGKNATFVFAFGKDGSVEDVTSSYTTHEQGLIERRRVSRGVNSTQVQRALHRTKDMWV